MKASLGFSLGWAVFWRLSGTSVLAAPSLTPSILNEPPLRFSSFWSWFERLAVRRTFVGRFGAALAAVCLLFAATSSPAQSAAMPLGVNLEGVSDAQRCLMFVDAVRSARPFGSADAPWDQSAPLDANGWPTSDAGVVIMNGSSDPPIDISGTYHLSFNGTAVVSPVGCSFTVTSQVYDPPTDRTTADVQVPANLGPGQYGLGNYIVFSDMTADSIVIEAWPDISLGILNLHFPWADFMAPVNAVQLVSRPSVILSEIASIITVPPQSQVAVAGSSPTFQVFADGSTPLTYQWQFNGVDLGGATNAAFTVNNARIADDGNYSVIVRNAAGSATSIGARLTVNDTLDAPIITTQPQALSVAVGQPATFNVAAARTAISTYQWRWNGENISGATNPSLTLNNVQLSDSGNYSVLVANSAGSVASVDALLTVAAPPVITTQPQSQTMRQGSNVVFAVTTTGTEPLSYQWLFNDNLIDGATSAMLSLRNVQASDSGRYSVSVTNVAGGVTSTAATLTVITPPVFLAVTQSGGSITLTWSATAGQTYKAQYTTNFTQPNWSNLAVLTATNSTATTSETSRDTQRFYRIIWLP
jgi:hypothetical protein